MSIWVAAIPPLQPGPSIACTLDAMNCRTMLTAGAVSHWSSFFSSVIFGAPAWDAAPSSNPSSISGPYEADGPLYGFESPIVTEPEPFWLEPLWLELWLLAEVPEDELEQPAAKITAPSNTIRFISVILLMCIGSLTPRGVRSSYH